jgi:hypothetical protein
MGYYSDDLSEAAQPETTPMDLLLGFTEVDAMIRSAEIVLR